MRPSQSSPAVAYRASLSELRCVRHDIDRYDDSKTVDTNRK